MTSPYAVLGLPEGAPIEEVKKAYRRLVLQWHPDKNPHRKEEAEEQFKRISAAYSAICDPPAATRRDARDIFREFFGNRDPFSSSFFDDSWRRRSDNDDFFADFRANQQPRPSRFDAFDSTFGSSAGWAPRAQQTTQQPGTSRKTETIIMNGKKTTRITTTTVHADGRVSTEVSETVEAAPDSSSRTLPPMTSATAVRIPISFKR